MIIFVPTRFHVGKETHKLIQRIVTFIFILRFILVFLLNESNCFFFFLKKDHNKKYNQLNKMGIERKGFFISLHFGLNKNSICEPLTQNVK